LIYNDNIQIKETIKNFGRFNIKFRIYTCKTIKHKEALEYMIKEDTFINELKDKNKLALEYMINNYSSYVFSICKAIIGAHGTLEDIEECVSDIFILVWENSYKYHEEKANFKTWLTTVTKYKAIDLNRKLVKNLNYVASDNIEIPNCDSVENELISKEASTELLLCIKNLKGIDKEIFIKRYFFNESIEDMARSYNISRQAVDNRLYRTKKVLKSMLISKNEEVLI
jgi:RNA polymerase sigma-70 factor (ECF subfamily)